MEYCCHIWAGAPSCYLELLDKLQKRICRTVGSSRLIMVYRYYVSRYSFERAQLVPLPFPRERSTHYSDRSDDFCVTIPRSYKDVYVDSVFPRTTRLWNSLPLKCFPLNNDLNGFKSRINRQLLKVLSKGISCMF